MKLRTFVGLYVAFFAFFFGPDLARAQANTGLVIDGSVMGYELYLVKPMLGPLMYPMLVKIQKVIEGKEKSQYILVGSDHLTKEFAEEKFGRDNTSTFRLVRQPFCDQKVRNLFYSGFTKSDGKIVKTDQTFTLVHGISKRDLPLKATVPCYVPVKETSDYLKPVSRLFETGVRSAIVR